MVEISTSGNISKLEINDYNGNSRENFKQLIKFRKFPEELNFFRERDNHSYIVGEINYQGECRNNLIVSSYEINSLKNVKNALIFANLDKIEISPISTFSDFFEENKKLLLGKINYHIPKRVFMREDLPLINLDSLKEKLTEKYGLKPKKISHLGGGRSQNGGYFIQDETKRKFVFKFRGEDEERSELISKMLNKVPEYFPKIYPRLDGFNRYTLEIGGNRFGLEEFIEQTEKKEISLEYFSLFGKHLGKFHNQLSLASLGDAPLKKILTCGENFNESSMFSLYIDLINNEKKGNELFLKFINEMVSGDFYKGIKGLPSKLIHRDLNSSNVLWIGDKPKIIDLEFLGFYKRINEFVAPLLLDGNMRRPNYLKSSFQNLIESYDSVANETLSQNEKEILPNLLKYSLLKFYVVRSIRRGIEDREYLQVLKNNFKDIGEKND
jgi:Ser/Thr protein kinase RdoA (MazF antagonist)